jgi:hypothetical protein
VAPLNPALDNGYQIVDFIYHQNDDYYTVTIANPSDLKETFIYTHVSKKNLAEYLNDQEMPFFEPKEKRDVIVNAAKAPEVVHSGEHERKEYRGPSLHECIEQVCDAY